MLDLLLKCEKDGLIDDRGIKEEVDTFVFAVIIQLHYNFYYIYKIT